ncbi:hypothetical protein C8Q79DRAFT_735177 [Trametes meyenii]|nr:hypothetical protein C8Q79DRAFT_735177 [Trametes meyenii]
MIVVAVLAVSGIFRLASLVNSGPRTRCQRGTMWDASRTLARQTTRRIRSTVTRKANPNTSTPFHRARAFGFARSQGLWQPGDTITALFPAAPRTKRDFVGISAASMRCRKRGIYIGGPSTNVLGCRLAVLLFTSPLSLHPPHH